MIPTKVFVVSVLCALALASPHPPPPKPSKIPPPPPPPPKCYGVELCCQNLSEPGSFSYLLEHYHAELTHDQKNQKCGQTCKPYDYGGYCFEKKACCDKQYEGGVLAIGCKEY